MRHDGIAQWAQYYVKRFRRLPASQSQTQLEESLQGRAFPAREQRDRALPCMCDFQVCALSKLVQMGYGCVRSSGSADPHGVDI